MEHLPKVLPGYYWNRGVMPYDAQCCQIYSGPNGKNPIPNGYGAPSLAPPLDYGENQVQARCGVAPSYKQLRAWGNLRQC